MVAQFICSRCEVIDLCLNTALKSEERFGVWGGMTERRRRQLVRLQAADADKALVSEFVKLARASFDKETPTGNALRDLLRKAAVVETEDDEDDFANELLEPASAAV